MAISGYLLATFLIAKRISAHDRNAPEIEHHETSVNAIFVIACFSWVAHLVYANAISHTGSTINFSLSSMTCLVSLVIVIIFLLGSLAMPIRTLGVLVFPLTATSLLFSFLWGYEVGSQNPELNTQGLAFASHIMVSLLSYALITIAAIQSLLFMYQERLIKKRTASTMLLALPPLQTMEQLLFRLVTVGFALLSLTLLSGIIFSQEIFGQPFTFEHHTIIASLSWLVFAILLFKRFNSGLRGSPAAIWTLAGFLLMQLGYFGTKIVTESLNIQ
ncbi:cytochrome c biogenesis protein CcsA [Arenicella sp.]|nr:cytochrome c biogenesis protein CcsA [Arenicella sp.]